MKKKILLLGIVHSAQADKLLQSHIKILKERKFSRTFIKKDEEKIKCLRKEMLERIRVFKPEAIAEESGPWIKEPGDQLKKVLGGHGTILEKKYKGKHFFVDAKMDSFPQKPSYKVREKEIIKSVLDKLDNNLNNIAIIVGAHHFSNIKKSLKKHPIFLQGIDLKKKYRLP